MGRGNSTCKGPEIEPCLRAERDTEEASSWSGATEGESGRRRGGREVPEQVTQGLVGHSVDFGFYPE